MTKLVASEVLEGELSHCICRSTEREGHTFSCIMAQHDRKVKVGRARLDEMSSKEVYTLLLKTEPEN